MADTPQSTRYSDDLPSVEPDPYARAVSLSREIEASVGRMRETLHAMRITLARSLGPPPP